MNKSKLKKLLAEKGYLIEALEDELEYHVEAIVEKNKEIDKKHTRIVELVHENDRLTLTYEPYRPPGDENEGLGYYDLINENNTLVENVLDKIAVIRELDDEITDLKNQINTLQKLVITETLKKPDSEFQAPPTKKTRSIRFWSR